MVFLKFQSAEFTKLLMARLIKQLRQSLLVLYYAKIAIKCIVEWGFVGFFARKFGSFLAINIQMTLPKM